MAVENLGEVKIEALAASSGASQDLPRGFFGMDKSALFRGRAAGTGRCYLKT